MVRRDVSFLFLLIELAVTRVLSLVVRQEPDSTFAPFCKFGSRGSFSGDVWVYVDVKSNQRSFTFDPNSMGTQTMISCKGSTPLACAGSRAKSINETQSCESLGCDCDPDVSTIDFVYMKRMLEILAPMCEVASSERAFNVLLIGLGGGALPDYVLQNCPKSTKFESVEYDPRVIDAATNFFGLHLSPGVNEVQNADGGEAVQQRVKQGQKYDVVMVDCFQAGDVVPDSCRNAAFVQGLHKIMKPGGKVIQQIWHEQLDATLKTYQNAFGEHHVEGRNVQLGFNFLIVAEA